MAQRSTSPSNTIDFSQWLTARNAMIFGAGAIIATIATRLMPPVAGRTIGSLRAMTGTDPFDALSRDHQKVLALFEQIEQTDDKAVARRNAMLLQAKRMLTAHALAEEDIVYPMLHDDAHRQEQAKKMYRDHAEVKVKLFELEHMAKDDPRWISDLRGLHRMVREHAQEEEREEFPRLRAALNDAQCANLLGEVSREKSMLL
jgi:hemerythrin superfamily protein